VGTLDLTTTLNQIFVLYAITKAIHILISSFNIILYVYLSNNCFRANPWFLNMGNVFYVDLLYLIRSLLIEIKTQTCNRGHIQHSGVHQTW